MPNPEIPLTPWGDDEWDALAQFTPEAIAECRDALSQHGGDEGDRFGDASEVTAE